ncbi:MAG: DNRLRE domain-containing protein [Desulfobacterales bacterium]|nr:DNRLRE domain-containing protein [Desulfobacterales bacterium]
MKRLSSSAMIISGILWFGRFENYAGRRSMLSKKIIGLAILLGLVTGFAGTPWGQPNTEKPYDTYSVVKVNPDGTNTIKVFGAPVNYWSGKKWLALEEIFLFLPEKAAITLEKKKDIYSKAILSNANRIKFKLSSCQLPRGIKIRLKNDKLVIKDKRNKTLRTLSIPFSYDSRGKKILCTYDIDQYRDITNLFISVPRDWLLSDKRVYPITVDPIYTTPTSNKEAWINTGDFDPSSSPLCLSAGHNMAANIVMEWTLPPDPGGTITDIKLFLYFTGEVGCPGLSTDSNFELHELLETPFVESEATWDNRDASNTWTTAGAKAPNSASATVVDTVTLPYITPPAGWYTWVLKGTGAANPVNWNWNETHSFVIYDPNPVGTDDKTLQYKFNHKESADNQPYIELTYTPTFVDDTDNDGISDAEEDACLNGGDANNHGTGDSQ